MPIGNPYNERSLTSAQGFIYYIKGVLSQRGVIIPEIPPTILIAYSDPLIERAKSSYHFLPVNIGTRKPTEIFFFRPIQGPEFAMVSPQYGDAMAVTTLEELIALGFQNFLSLGTAGHPTDKNVPQLSVGDAISVNDALSYEGTSRHYSPAGTIAKADKSINEVLRRLLAERDIRFHEGRVATTSGIYRETPSFVRKVLSKGAIALDMETSALLTVAEYHKKPMGTLLYVSDVIKVREGTSNGWEVDFLSGSVAETEQKVFEVAMKLVNRLQ